MKRSILSLLVMGLFAGMQIANGQTIYDWQATAPDGNFRQGAAGVRWSPGSLQDEPTGMDVVLQFNNNTQPTLTNNVSGYTIHGLLFGPSSSSRTLGGSSLAFVKLGGVNPYISNTTSGVSHILTLPITGDGTVPLEIRPAAGNLTMNGSIDNMGASLWVNGGTGRTLAIGGSISGAGSLELRNNDIVTLTATNTYGGSTIITNSGTLNFSSNAQLGSGIDVRINGGTLSLTAGTVNTSRNFILGPSTGSGTGTISVSSTLTINGLVSNDGSGTGNLTKTGNGTLILQNTSNTYSGITTISQGVLTVPSDACLGTSSNVYLNNGTTFSITSGADVTTRNFYIGPSSGAGSATVNVSATSYTINGMIANNGTSNSSLFKAGTGTLILGGVFKSFGGGSNPLTTISAGGIRILGTNMLPSAMGLSMANSSGVFFDLNGYNQQFASLSGGGTSGGNILLNGGTLTVNSQTATTFDGTIIGTGSLVKNGVSTLVFTLTGNHQLQTWTTTIGAGTLLFNTAASYPQNTDLRINNNATFAIGNSNTSKFNIGVLTMSSGGVIDLGLSNSPFDVEILNSGPLFSGTLTIRNWNYFANKRILFTNTTHIATVLTNITFEGYGPGAVFKGATNEIIPASLYFTISPAMPASGNFTDPSIWQGGVVPPANSAIVILPNFSLNFDMVSLSLRSIDVAAGGVFSCAANNQLTLGASGYGKLSNFGQVSFSNGTIFINSSGAIFDGNAAMTLYNLTLNSLLSSKTSPTVNGTLLFNSNAAIGISTIIYGPLSTLQYNCGSTYYMAREWNNWTTPANIIVGGNTTLATYWAEIGDMACSGNLTIESGSSLNLSGKRGNLSISGDFNIHGGLTLCIPALGNVTTSFHIYLNGNWTRTATAPAVNFNNRAVWLQGIRNTTITAPPGEWEEFRVLKINKSGSGKTVTLNSPVYVSSELYLLNGYFLATSSNYFGMGNWSAVVTGGTFNSFISGPMRKFGQTCAGSCNGTIPFTFPFGKIVGSEYHYRPLTISGVASSSFTYYAEFQRSNPHLQGPISAAARAKGLQEISYCEYWDLTRSSGANAVQVTIGWSTNTNGRSQCNANAYVNQPSSLVVVPYYNGQWGDFQTGADAGDELYGYDAHSNPASSLFLGTVRWNGQIDSYQKFVLGTTSVLMNPLPESQFQLKGNLKSNTAYLNWTMRSNLLYQNYLVQNSNDGIQFRDVKEVSAYSITGVTDYQYLHVEPSTGWKFYRIVAVNQEGQRFVSNTIRLWAGNATGSLVVFPNPVSNNRIQLFTTGLEKGRYVSHFTGMDGRVWMQRVLFFAGNGQVESIGMDPGIPSGVYWLTLSREGMEPVRIKIVK